MDEEVLGCLKLSTDRDNLRKVRHEIHVKVEVKKKVLRQKKLLHVVKNV